MIGHRIPFKIETSDLINVIGTLRTNTNFTGGGVWNRRRLRAGRHLWH